MVAATMAATTAPYTDLLTTVEEPVVWVESGALGVSAEWVGSVASAESGEWVE
jgi:hypothetical protein